MILRLLFVLNSMTAFGQSFDSFVFHPGKHSAYGREKLSIPGFPDYPLVNEDLKVSLKPGSAIYSDNEHAKDPSSVSWLPVVGWKQRCSAGSADQEISGKLLHAGEDYALIRADAPVKHCGRFFNNAMMDDNVVFVNKKDVATIVPRARTGENAKTEAGFNNKLREENPDCVVCKLTKKDDVLREMAIKAKANLVYAGPEKPVPEQERYFACYRTPYQDNYNRYYKKLFEIAAKVFQVTFTHGQKGEIKPLNTADYESEDDYDGKGAPAMVGSDAGLMKCVGLRESSWNPQTESKTGAMGIGQQTGDNIEHINCMIRGCVREGRTLSARPWAADMWARYQAEVKKAFPPKEYQRLMTNPRDGKPCVPEMADKLRDAPCPINSIGALALYHIVAELQIRKSSPLYKDPNDVRDFNKAGERLSFKVTRGATTNAGTGSAQRTVQKYENPNDWPRFIGLTSGRQKEVGDYVRFITNCIESGNMKPYFDVATKKGVDKNGQPFKPYRPPNCYTPQIDRAVDEVMAVK